MIVANSMSLPKKFIHVREYAKKEQIIKLINVAGNATAIVFKIA